MPRDLSLVVPAFNAATFVVPRLVGLTTFLDSTGLDWEVVVVDDGSTDGTGALLDGLLSERIRALHLCANRGKFGALAAGVAEVTGRACVFTDADVPYNLDAIPWMVDLVTRQGFHVAVGDRSLDESAYEVVLPPVRRVATHLVTLLIRLLVTSGLHDTQCGLKALRGDVARALFPLLRETGFAGDVELLYVALKYNLAVRRVPVRLRYQGPSSVHPARDGLRFGQALVRIKANHVRGLYRSEELRSISRQYGLQP